MENKIATALKIKYQPVAIILTDQKPEVARKFKEKGRAPELSIFQQ